MNLISILRRPFVIHLSIRQCQINFMKLKSTVSKQGDLKINLKMKTPIGKLDELEAGKHPFQEKEPLKEWPGGRNPGTGEHHGPKGPEPTRYGDWERKGRVSDF